MINRNTKAAQSIARNTNSRRDNGQPNSPSSNGAAAKHVSSHADRPSLSLETTGFDADSLDVEGSSDPLTATAPIKDRQSVRQRTLSPTIVVSLGGSGNAAASCLKRIIRSQRTPNHVRFLAFDTDEHAQSGAGDGNPGFSDDEFTHISVDRIRNVVEHPDQHPMLTQRHGLNNPKQVVFFKGLFAQGISQGGQVRPYGNLGFHANFLPIRGQIERVIASLKGAYSDLEKQLGSEDMLNIRRRLTIYVVSSLAGGTGSSMMTDVVHLLRERTRLLDAEIIGIQILPSAFRTVVKGHREQELRMLANAYAAMVESNAFARGIGTAEKLRLGPDERNSVPAMTSLYNEYFVVGAETADGRNLGSPQAVEQTVALHLSALIGTEVNDQVALSHANHATLQGITPDPRTQQPREIGTISATSLTLPSEKVARDCGSRYVGQLLQTHVVGQESGEFANSTSDAWLGNPLDGGGCAMTSDGILNHLQRIVIPNTTVLARPMFRHSGPSGNVHYGTSEFVEKATSVIQRFRTVQRADLDGRLQESASALAADCVQSLRELQSRLIAGKGFRTVKAVIHQLKQQIVVELKKLQAIVESETHRGETALRQATEILATLRRQIRDWTKDKRRKNLTAERIHEGILGMVRAISAQAAIRVVTALVKELSDMESVCDSVLLKAKERINQIRSTLKPQDANDKLRITAGSFAEINVLTPEIEQSLFRRFRPDDADVIQQLSKRFAATVPGVIGEIATNSQVFNQLLELLNNHYLERLHTISIVDVLAPQLSDPKSARDTIAKIRQAVVGCQPLWKADSGQLSTEFADTMIVGIPASQDAGNRQTVCASLIEAATRRINPNGQYNGEAMHVMSSDPHRIYIIRRTQGACLYYLPEVRECEAAYREWKAIGGHSVHIFNDELVAKMPSLLPDDVE